MLSINYADFRDTQETKEHKEKEHKHILVQNGAKLYTLNFNLHFSCLFNSVHVFKKSVGLQIFRWVLTNFNKNSYPEKESPEFLTNL